MAPTLYASPAAVGGHCGGDLVQGWRAPEGIGGAVRRGASPDPDRAAETGGGAGLALALACHTHDRREVLLRVGDGRPVSIGKRKYIMSRSIHRKCKPDVKLEDLPADILRKIFSKLSNNEVVRTSVLSSKWRRMWTISSKLSLDNSALCAKQRFFGQFGQPMCTGEFIDTANSVLQQIQGEIVEDFEVKVTLALRIGAVQCFSRLKILRLLVNMDCGCSREVFTLMMPLLIAAPFLEELEVHFYVYDSKKWLDVYCSPEALLVRGIPPCPRLHLRSLLFKGFTGIAGQVEFLVHLVENAPFLKVLTIDTESMHGVPLYKDVQERLGAEARKHLAGKISPGTLLRIL